jgi:hypothetical protein
VCSSFWSLLIFLRSYKRSLTPTPPNLLTWCCHNSAVTYHNSGGVMLVDQIKCWALSGIWVRKKVTSKTMTIWNISVPKARPSSSNQPCRTHFDERVMFFDLSFWRPPRRVFQNISLHARKVVGQNHRSEETLTQIPSSENCIKEIVMDVESFCPIKPSTSPLSSDLT